MGRDKNLLLETVRENFKPNSRNEYILDINSHILFEGDNSGSEICTLWIKSNQDVCVIKEDEEVYTPTDEEMYTLAGYVQDNRFILENREIVKVLESGEDKLWEGEPVEIKGADDELIGRVGIVKKKEKSAEIYSVIFVSADGTWATLTMFEKKKKAIELAQADIYAIIRALTTLKKQIK